MCFRIEIFNGDKKHYLYDRFLCHIVILLPNILKNPDFFMFLFKISGKKTTM